ARAPETLRGQPAHAVHRLRSRPRGRARRLSNSDRGQQGGRREVPTLLADRPVDHGRGRTRGAVQPLRRGAGGASQPLKRSLELAVVAAVAIADQVTKLLVVAELGLLQTVPVIPGVLNLTHVRNSGVAFGILNSADFAFKPALMAVFALGALVGVGLYA